MGEGLSDHSEGSFLRPFMEIPAGDTLDRFDDQFLDSKNLRFGSGRAAKVSNQMLELSLFYGLLYSLITFKESKLYCKVDSYLQLQICSLDERSLIYSNKFDIPLLGHSDYTALIIF